MNTEQQIENLKEQPTKNILKDLQNQINNLKEEIKNV